jgi:hypothetical protein
MFLRLYSSLQCSLVYEYTAFEVLTDVVMKSSAFREVGLICSSETSVGFQRTTRRYITEDSTLRTSSNLCQ